MVYRSRNIIRVGSYSGKNTKRKGAGESTENMFQGFQVEGKKRNGSTRESMPNEVIISW
jgi:hypothetical protein